MSFQIPPRLLELAGQSLLRDEALAIPALEELPRELFPPLFMEAFTGGYSKTLTAMVQAWPFTCLPLGSLMHTPDLETLRAVLDGLDLLLAQKVHSSRWKLQVLDLRDVDGNFWSIWSGWPVRFPEAWSQRQTVEDCPGVGRQQSLKVFIEGLCTKDWKLNECLAYVFKWAQQRKDLLHLCCKSVVIYEMPIYTLRKFLERLDLNCIQDVTMCNHWGLYQLIGFVPYLAQMKSLRKLHFTWPRTDKVIAEFTSMSLSFRPLMYIDPILMNHLYRLISCLVTPLESLAITGYWFSEPEMEDVFMCPSMRQLRELNLTGVTLRGLNPEPLKLLLENIAATLQILLLKDCWVTDAQLSVILPALSHCHQLEIFDFRGNQISRVSLENLLRHTTGLCELSLEIYPVPRECYSYDFKDIYWQRFLQLRAELIEILRDLRQPKRIIFTTIPCSYCGRRAFYDLEPSACNCGVF
ncbi:PRAME family member 12-like [Otolemur garnettii]|uniref:PRAME family member 12-like n=1 Tax=Otolemur garnettii TaxID=30611 RepID=UPI000C7F65EB|nr:PRAME family member 12-like [Otolemur garnettii]